MIVLVGGTKGGTGKSTISQNLAAWLANEGKKFLLIDADKNASCKKWYERRTDAIAGGLKVPEIICSEKTGKTVGTFAKQSEDSYGIVLIDAGGKDSFELRSGMTAADLMIIPLSPSQKELESLEELFPVLEESLVYNPDLKVLIVLTRVDSSRAKDEFRMAREALESITWAKLSNNKLSFLKAYRTADVNGLSVVEVSDSGSAKAEIQLLAQEVFSTEKE